MAGIRGPAADPRARAVRFRRAKVSCPTRGAASARRDPRRRSAGPVRWLPACRERWRRCHCQQHRRAQFPPDLRSRLRPYPAASRRRPLALVGVGPVALEALVGQDRLDVAIEVDFSRGRLGQRSGRPPRTAQQPDGQQNLAAAPAHARFSASDPRPESQPSIVFEFPSGCTGPVAEERAQSRGFWPPRNRFRADRGAISCIPQTGRSAARIGGTRFRRQRLSASAGGCERTRDVPCV